MPLWLFHCYPLTVWRVEFCSDLETAYHSRDAAGADDDAERAATCLEPAAIIADLLSSIDEVNQVVQVKISAFRLLGHLYSGFSEYSKVPLGLL